eukprot:3414958-Amphidinium_carterae.1
MCALPNLFHVSDNDDNGGVEMHGMVRCEKCGGGVDFLPFILSIVLGVLGICVVTVVINRNLHMQSHATL